MVPHARTTSMNEQSSPPPPPPKDQPSLAHLTTESPAQSSSTFSPPIKRKPLPPSAFSPKALSPQSQTSQQPGRVIAPASSSVLSQILDSPVETSHNVNSQFPPRQDSYTLAPARTASSDQLERFPLPPQPANGSHHNNADEKVEISITEEVMAPAPADRPPPLRMDSVTSVKSTNMKKASPGNKFTAFFSRKPLISPSAESEATEISDSRSPMPSPYPQSDQGSTSSALNSYFGLGLAKHSSPHGSQDSSNYESSIQPLSRVQSDVGSRYNVLEAELREISVELAGSIKRELDLEDLVERLQNESHITHGGDRTSDYFSDSGTSSLRGRGGEFTTKDEIDKFKREAEQQRAALKIELSQKWQEEASQRTTLESHLQRLEQQVAQSRQFSSQASDASSRVRELESFLDDSRRRLNEERKVKENFEDLSKALKSELEQARGMTSQMAREIQNLKDENAALKSAREIERMHFIAEEEDYASPTSMLGPRSGGFGGLSRSNTVQTGRINRSGRSGSLSRSNSITRGSPIDPTENVAEKIKSVEQQRDALHTTVRYLRTRHDQQKRQFEKRARLLQAELDRSNNAQSKRSGYEREVRVLRAEINTLRKRADDALDQKWQCEKGLAGLKMDLDRNKQETANLQQLLQARNSDPDSQALSSITLENAIVELQRERQRTHENASRIEQEERLAEQLEESAGRSEALASQVKKQLQANQSLRIRLKNAVESGEQDQKALTHKINDLQNKLKKYEDAITSAQIQSETAVMKHEEEVRVIKASNNAQLLRSISGKQSSNLLTPTIRSPLSPMFANSKKSPRLDNTSTGPGMPLHEALRTEYLETKVGGLEKALADAEKEMGEVIQRMNGAQISVAELEAERDDALKQTRILEAAIQKERQKYKDLLSTLK